MSCIRAISGIALAASLAGVPSLAQTGTCGVATPVLLAASNGKKGDTLFPSYMDDSFAQLKKEVPALHGMKFEARPATTAADTEPDESALILAQTGAAITEMLPRVPHLIAKEELSQVAVPLPYVVGEARQAASFGGRRGAAVSQGYTSSERGLEGMDLWHAIDSMLTSNTHRAIFAYRIQSTPDPKYGFLFKEYRTNTRNESVDVSNAAGSPHGVGFGNSWLVFHPDNAKDLRYRFLGRQKVGKHETFVVAFAQIPGQVALPGAITIGNTTCEYLSQGIVWIDETIFQIVRLQSDLLAPVSELQLTRLRSELTFAEIRIPERNLSLWMPKDVLLSWQMKDQAAAELHRYSDYKLFTATSRIILP
jgi:hypothetical protein